MSFNAEILKAALEGLELRLARINTMMGEIKQRKEASRPGRAAESAVPAVQRKRRQLSPEARERMAEAQRKRWQKKSKENPKAD